MKKGARAAALQLPSYAMNICSEMLRPVAQTGKNAPLNAMNTHKRSGERNRMQPDPL